MPHSVYSAFVKLQRTSRYMTGKDRAVRPKGTEFESSFVINCSPSCLIDLLMRIKMLPK